MYQPRSRIEWVYVVVIANQAIGTFVLDLVVLLQYFSWINPVVYQVPASYVVPVNFGTYILGNVCLAGLAFDALRAKNNLQLFGISLANLGVFLFSIFRYEQTSETAKSLRVGYALGNRPFVDTKVDFWHKAQPALLTSSILVGLCMVSSWLCVYRLNQEFAWAIYRHISGSLATRQKYLTYQVLLVVIKLEAYFLVAFIIVYGLVNVHFELPEFPLTITLIPLLVIQIAMTIYFTKREQKLGAIAAIILRVLELAYLTSRIVTLCGNGRRANTLLKNEMLLFAGFSLAFATFACLNAILCVMNFDHGLKALLLDSGWKRNRYEFEPIHHHARLSARLELD